MKNEYRLLITTLLLVVMVFVFAGCSGGTPAPAVTTPAPAVTTTTAPPVSKPATTAPVPPATTSAPAPVSPVGTLTPVNGPAIPHTLDGRADCLLCHRTGIGGARPIPTNHAGRTNDTCSLCHKPR